MRRATLIATILLSCCIVAWGQQPPPDSKNTERPLTAQSAAANPTSDSLEVLAKSLTDNPDDINAIDRYLKKLQVELSTLALLQPDQAKKAFDAAKQILAQATERTSSPSANRRLATADEFMPAIERRIQVGFMSMADLRQRVINEPGNSQFLIDYQQRVYQDVRRLARVQPETATKTIHEAKAVLQMVEATAAKESVKKLAADFSRRLDSLAESLGQGDTLTGMIGKDAAPLKVDAWINGSVLTDDDLKGKVVLLDFTAVWCGPCIATFPHLREWNEKYTDKGLVLIGVTRYYNFAWDEQEKKASKSEQTIRRQDEQAMLIKFAETHELKHRLVIEVGRSLSDFYGVVGIPHVVIIDREGKIRLMRVGSGVDNAKEIGDMLAQLLDATPAAGQ